MAPPQTPKNKKQTQNASTPHTTDGMGPASAGGEVPLPLETYEKAQEDEREVLKAVFMDDYEEAEAKGAWSVRFEVQSLNCTHLSSFSNRNAENY